MSIHMTQNIISGKSKKTTISCLKGGNKVMQDLDEIIYGSDNTIIYSER